MVSTTSTVTNEPGFYERDKRWLVSHDKQERLERGDRVEVRRRSDGAVRIVKIQDEVVLYPSGNGKKRFYLMKDETELIEQGYRPDAFLGRYRRIDGTWLS